MNTFFKPQTVGRYINCLELEWKEKWKWTYSFNNFKIIIKKEKKMDAGSKILKLTSILLLTSQYIVHYISFPLIMINYNLHITDNIVYLDLL